MLTPFLLLRGEGVHAGSVRLLLRLPGPVEVRGSSYKVVKSLVQAGCPGFQYDREASRFLSVSPLHDPMGRPVLQVVRGWRREVEVRPVVLRGSYTLEVSWAGPGAREAERLVSCLQQGPADVETLEASFEALTGLEAVRGEVVLLTPAQFKVKILEEKSIVVQYPQPHKLLHHALDLLVPEADRLDVYRDLDYYVVLANARVEPVTIVLDEEKPTNWAVTGRYELAVARGAPSRVRSLLGQALLLARYVGVGKSRLEGLGRAEARPLSP